jgi:hypothetical protein
MWFVFFSVLDPFTLLGGRNFMVFNLFRKKISASDAPRRGVQVFVRTSETTEPSPWIRACPERLSVSSPAILP